MEATEKSRILVRGPLRSAWLQVTISRLQWLDTSAGGRRAGLGLRNQKDSSVGGVMYRIVLLCLLSLWSKHCLFGIALGCQPGHIRTGLAGIHCLI